MNWKVILFWSLLGWTLGLVRMLEWTYGWDWLLWLCLGAACLVWMGRNLLAHPFLHGLLVGLIGSVGLVPAVGMYLFRPYVGNAHAAPWALRVGLTLSLFLKTVVPGMVLLGGLILGLGTWALHKSHRPRVAAPAA